MILYSYMLAFSFVLFFSMQGQTALKCSRLFYQPRDLIEIASSQETKTQLACELYELDRKIFASPWPKIWFHTLLRLPKTKILTARRNGKLVGSLISFERDGWWAKIFGMDNSSRIITVGILPEYRSTGIYQKIISTWIDEVAKTTKNRKRIILFKTQNPIVEKAALLLVKRSPHIKEVKILNRTIVPTKDLDSLIPQITKDPEFANLYGQVEGTPNYNIHHLKIELTFKDSE